MDEEITRGLRYIAGRGRAVRCWQTRWRKPFRPSYHTAPIKIAFFVLACDPIGVRGIFGNITGPREAAC